MEIKLIFQHGRQKSLNKINNNILHFVRVHKYIVKEKLKENIHLHELKKSMVKKAMYIIILLENCTKILCIKIKYVQSVFSNKY